MCFKNTNKLNLPVGWLILKASLNTWKHSLKRKKYFIWKKINLEKSCSEAVQRENTGRIKNLGKSTDLLQNIRVIMNIWGISTIFCKWQNPHVQYLLPYIIVVMGWMDYLMILSSVEEMFNECKNPSICSVPLYRVLFDLESLGHKKKCTNSKICDCHLGNSRSRSLTGKNSTGWQKKASKTIYSISFLKKI